MTESEATQTTVPVQNRIVTTDKTEGRNQNIIIATDKPKVKKILKNQS